MPLTDEEWRAFISEYNGAMDDVETDLYLAVEGIGLALENLAARGTIPRLEAEALFETARESLLRVQDRLNAYGRRILRMRESGEL